MTLMVVFVALYSFATPLGYAMQEVSEFSLDFVAGFLTGLSMASESDSQKRPKTPRQTH